MEKLKVRETVREVAPLPSMRRPQAESTKLHQTAPGSPSPQPQGLWVADQPGPHPFQVTARLHFLPFPPGHWSLVPEFWPKYGRGTDEHGLTARPMKIPL